MKPRARWHPYGVGFWTVRDFRKGWLYQGIGLTLCNAYENWSNSDMLNPKTLKRLTAIARQEYGNNIEAGGKACNSRVVAVLAVKDELGRLQGVADIHKPNPHHIVREALASV